MSRYVTAAAGFLLLAGLSLSLLTPHALMAACLGVALYGAWCFLTARWRWEKRDNPAAVVNIATVIFALGSAGICLLKGEPAEEMEPYLSLLCAPLLGIGLRELAPKPSRVAGAIAIASLIAAGIAAWQVLTAGQMQRATTQMGATSFGALGAIYAVLCASMSGWAARDKPTKLLLTAGSAAGVVVAVLSGSRGSWILLALVLPAAVVSMMPSGRRGLAVWMCVFLAAVFFAASQMPNSPVRERVIETLRIGDPLRTAFAREATKAFAGSPLCGVRRADLAAKLDRAWLAVRPYAPHETPPRHAHNELLDAAAVRGAGGLALNIMVLAVPVAVLWRLRKGEKHDGPATTGLLFMAAFLLAGTTDLLLQLTSRRMTFLFVVLFCIVSATERNGQNDTRAVRQ